jgi:hypothetical protein
MDNQELFAILKSIDASRRLIMKEVLKLDWQHLAANGLNVEAIMKYREKHKTSLVDSKNAVESFISSL